ncbi:MAG: glutamate--tRNA ligase [Candidatus Omnitrophica bacterium]|nr:glutamate--tRNA ligase [Candidatus Omnitrophota bacterium]
MVRVRFAPSPTGYLHIGGARTALFNWMYAKAQGGKFILRIEDTDKARSRVEFLDEILDSMKWLGLKWDELYKQSDRFDLYRQYAQKLLEQGKAYQDGEAVLLKMSANPARGWIGETSPSVKNKESDGGPQRIIKWFDLIRGEVQFDTKEIKDQVLMKSDGSPTYSFACVIDDALMEISCVIRGEDHISNTPKQIVIYEALGFKPPKFAHLPLILDDERARMSKRAGAVAVSDYRRWGFLPEAVVNYLMLLGWSPGNNQEKITLSAAVKNFSIKKINKAGAVFSLDKLKWLNGQYIKEMDTAKLAALIMPLLKEKYPLNGFGNGQRLENVVQLFKGRMVTLTDFLEWTDFIFADHLQLDEEARQKHLSQDKSREFGLLADALSSLSDFNAKTAEETFRRLVGQWGMSAGDLVHPVRVALTGRAVGPGLFDTMAVLGQHRTVERLRKTFN